MAFQEGCQIHHHNLVRRNYWNCQIQMCSDLEELNLKVVMTGVEMTLEMIGGIVGMGQKNVGMGEKVVGWGCHGFESSLDKRGM